MRILILLILVIAGAAGAAYVTKPGPEVFDATLRTALAERMVEADIAQSDSDIEALALVGCKFSPSECFRAVRALMDVRFEDKGLYTLAVISRPEPSTCYGVFGQFWCDKDGGI